MRDAGVSVRENFFTEQVEILRGPGSSFAGRGTTGGAINIVTKQASTEKSFYNMDTTFGTDRTKRVVLDVNQVISPTLAVRAGCSGRRCRQPRLIKDDRDGGFVAVKWTPLDTVKLYANYIPPTCMGCPTSACRIIGRGRRRRSTPTPPARTDFGANRNNFYWLRQSRLLQHQARTSGRSAARSRYPD
jgi:catecholate siderophore receptor